MSQLGKLQDQAEAEARFILSLNEGFEDQAGPAISSIRTVVARAYQLGRFDAGQQLGHAMTEYLDHSAWQNQAFIGEAEELVPPAYVHDDDGTAAAGREPDVSTAWRKPLRWWAPWRTRAVRKEWARQTVVTAAAAARSTRARAVQEERARPVLPYDLLAAVNMMIRTVAAADSDIRSLLAACNDCRAWLLLLLDAPQDVIAGRALAARLRNLAVHHTVHVPRQEETR